MCRDRCDHMFTKVAPLQMWREWDVGADFHRCLYWVAHFMVTCLAHYSDGLAVYRQWTAVTRRRFYSASLINVSTLSSHVLSHLSIAHTATVPLIQPHIYNSWRSSGFSFSLLPSTEAGLSAAMTPSCSESQWVDRVFIHHMGKTGPAMISPKYF